MSAEPNTLSHQGRGVADAIVTLISGALIGIANIIPGVSGGTFALILGVFDRMVAAINALGLATVRAVLGLFKGRFKASARNAFAKELRRVDAGFLALILIGSAVSIGGLSFLIEILLNEYYSPTLAFFVGLILPSVIVPYAIMEKKGARLLWIIPGIALTVGVSLAMPENTAGNSNPLIAAGSGAIAISAMLLPGISGSFVLLVLGQYQVALSNFTGLVSGLAKGTFDMDAAVWLAALAVGMVVGLALFAKLLSFLLRRAKSATMAFLIGLLLGSLFVLWPFKDISAGAAVTARDGKVKNSIQIATAPNRMPETWSETLVATGALMAGLVGSLGLIALGRRRNRDETSSS